MDKISRDIESGSFSPVYLLYGEEDYLKDSYKKKLRDAVLPEGDTVNFNLFSGKGIDLKEVMDLADTMPFFAAHRLIQIEDSGLFKTGGSDLAEYLPGMPEETVLLFVEDEVDRRGKLYKTVDKLGCAVEFGRQDEKTLTRWVLKRLDAEEKKIRKDAFSLFRDMTGSDMENISQELEKLISYTMGRSEITSGDVRAVCSPVSEEDRIFEMVRAVTAKRQKEALDIYYELLSNRESPNRILALLARQYNQMLLVKDLSSQGKSTAQIASEADMKAYAVKKTLEQASRYSEKSLISAVSECVETEQAVKEGNLNDRMAVELLLVQFSEKPDA